MPYRLNPCDPCCAGNHHHPTSCSDCSWPSAWTLHSSGWSDGGCLFCDALNADFTLNHVSGTNWQSAFPAGPGIYNCIQFSTAYLDLRFKLQCDNGNSRLLLSFPYHVEFGGGLGTETDYFLWSASFSSFRCLDSVTLTLIATPPLGVEPQGCSTYPATLTMDPA